MKLKQLLNKTKDKSNFLDIKGYIKFCQVYLDFVSDSMQAIIISQNENHYCFYQYKKKGHFQITRPINSNLMYEGKEFPNASKEILQILKSIKTFVNLLIEDIWKFVGVPYLRCN